MAPRVVRSPSIRLLNDYSNALAYSCAIKLSPDPPTNRLGRKITQRLAPHDVGLTAEGVALTEEESHPKEPEVEGNAKEYVLHRVLYLQVHENGFKKTKQIFFSRSSDVDGNHWKPREPSYNPACLL
jgi:hypothetical protein